VRGEDDSNVAVTAIPAQNKVTLQILSMWPPFKISSKPLRSRAVRNSFAFVCSSALSLRLRTRSYAQRWPAWNLKRRMPPDAYFGLNH
jgi:hypothetical protein